MFQYPDRLFYFRLAGLLLVFILGVASTIGSGGSSGGSVDNFPPSVLASSPMADAPDVPAKYTINAVFSKEMDPATVNDKTFIVSSTEGQIDCDLSISLSNATCTPKSPLKYNTSYTVTISSKASDLAGNQLGADYVWSFFTTNAGTGDTENYFPVTLGKKWSYQHTKTEYGYATEFMSNISTTGTKDINGVTATIFTETNSNNNGLTIDWLYYKDQDGITNYGNTDPSDIFTTQISPYQEINFPTHDGDSFVQIHKSNIDWGEDLDGDGLNESGNILSRITIEGIEPVPISTGTFNNCVKINTAINIELTLTYSGQTVTGTAEDISWFAPDVGPVKRSYIITVDGNAQTEESEIIPWTNIPVNNELEARAQHTAVWTGKSMIVWGGVGALSALLDTGAQYNYISNTWSPISTLNAPSARFGHSAVWTGTEMIIWGGGDYMNPVNTGARYNPTTDTWTTISTTNAPSARYDHSAIWTGSEMIVWGGYFTPSAGLSDGASYDPATDTWTTLSTTNTPSARYGHTAVWTGADMIIWGGDNGATLTATGGAYNPSTDTWTATSTNGAPSARRCHAAQWTGTEMIIFGGQTQLDLGCGLGNTDVDGARYNLGTDSWASMSNTNAPTIDYRNSIWTGTEMITWGKVDTEITNSGARYNPTSDSWKAISDINQPSGRFNHSAVWTGSDMLVWGGGISYGSTGVNTGGIYSVAHDPGN